MKEKDTDLNINDISNDNKLNKGQKIEASEIISEIKLLELKSEDLNYSITSFDKISQDIKSLKDISIIFADEVFDIFEKLSSINNIIINLKLVKLFMNILTNDSLYKIYLLFEKTEEKKINLIIRLIDQSIAIINKLNSLIFEPDIYAFKCKIIEFIKCFYLNCKQKILDDKKLNKLYNLIEELPNKFYSEKYNEIMRNKDMLDILIEKSIDKITEFEESFIDINNYFEQFDIFKLFIEKNTEKEKIEKKEDDSEEIKNFYLNYGTILLKFCKYHNYIFLDSKDEDIKNREKDDIPSLSTFLVDNPKSKEDEKITEILKNNQFHSNRGSKEYDELISKGINFYLKNTKKYENDPQFKNIFEQMTYYISTLNVESFVPLYLTSLNRINITDNFTPSFLVNVPAGKESKFYLQSKDDQDKIVYIEFFMDDTSKDITFKINKYDLNNNTYKEIYKEEKIFDKRRMFILNHEYALYEIVFDNTYSWFNSKDINYRVTFLNLLFKPKMEEEKIEIENQKNENKIEDNVKEEQIKEEKNVEEKCEFNLNGEKILLKIEEISKKIEGGVPFDYVPVILYMNNLRFITIDKNQNNIEDIKFKEILAEDDDKLITKSFFDYQLITYLKKLKIKPNANGKIKVSIYSENSDLSKISEEIDEQLKKEKDKKKIEFLKKVGFIPQENLDDFKIEYKLYNLSEQNLMYHIYLCLGKKVKISKPILFLKLDKLLTTYAIYNGGVIKSQIEEEIKGDKNEYIFNLIKYVHNLYKDIDIVLSYIDCKDEKKKELLELFENIKKFANEKLEPKAETFAYQQNEINIEIFKYMNLFYDC